MKATIHSAAVAAVLTMGGTSQAAQFFTVRGYPNAIAMTGEIVPGDEVTMRDVLIRRTTEGKTTNAILLDSVGGELDTASKIASGIRYLGYETMVGASNTCASACVLVFAAGSRRSVWEGAQIGVHSAVYDDGTEAEAATVQMSRLLKSYGVPAAVIGKLVTTTPSDIAFLTTADLSGWTTSYSAVPQQQEVQHAMTIPNKPSQPELSMMDCRSTKSNNTYRVSYDGANLWINGKPRPTTGYYGHTVTGTTKYGIVTADFGSTPKRMVYEDTKGGTARDTCW